ncbi:MAG: penicillin-binding protein 2 [Betaproteobacteria bacterium]|nr:penicillin-binding protein 2 [Betaproteobacteria bacterium]
MKLTTREELDDTEKYQARLQVAAVFIIAAFGVLLARLLVLQTVQYEYYHTLAESNRISLVPSPPNRGLITDRNGVVLAENRAVYTLEVYPKDIADLKSTLRELSGVIDLNDADLRRFDKRLRESRKFDRVAVKSFLSDAEVARFAAAKYRFAGVELTTRLFRSYPMGTTAAHVLGHVGRISPRDKAALEARGETPAYLGIESIGKDGVEKTYEAELRGVAGYAEVETDAAGRGIRTLSQTASTPGNRLRLALDIQLQKIGEEAFAGRRGAAVAIEPATGDILALVSQPSFDPNAFVDGIDPATWRQLNDSRDRPLTNRPLRGAYPPGSTIKPFMALAALETGTRPAERSIFDPGYYTLPGQAHHYRCWKSEGHGAVDLHRSVVVSCDTYYYGLAVEMGIERMHDFLARFNFGKVSGIDIEGERSGLNPNEAWKRARFKDKWYAGDTVSAGIGQGYVLATPMQLAYATAVMANRGTAFRPHLAKEVVDIQSGKLRRVQPKPEYTTHFDEGNLERVLDAMVGVTQPGGTASQAAAGAPYRIAGKTGTAQVIGIKQGHKYRESEIDERYRDHAWFIAFAPAEAPRIALAILVENGGHGGSAAAPVARKMMDYWLLGKMPDAPAEVAQ